MATENTVAMCAAGTMPGALQVLWQAAKGGYHMEYGYSCMGYEIAGAMGIKLADPTKEVICFVGDGSYMMANSELATAVMRRVPFTVVLTDNRGYGCINRLQQECGGAEFNNMYKDFERRGAARDRLRRPRRLDGRPRREGRATSPTSRRGSSPPAAATCRRSSSSTPRPSPAPAPAATGGTSPSRRSAAPSGSRRPASATTPTPRLQRVFN